MQGSEWVTDMIISSELTVIKGENDDKDLPKPPTLRKMPGT